MKTVPIILLAMTLILVSIVNMQQDRRIQDLTDRISKLEQTK